MKNIILTTVSEPKKDCNGSPVFLTDETIEERKQKYLPECVNFILIN